MAALPAHTPPRLPRERESGCVEYKRQLLTSSRWRFEQLVSQCKWRLAEGEGRCTYFVGVDDDGDAIGLAPAPLAASLATLRAMAAQLGCVARVAAVVPGRAPGCSFARVVIARARAPCLAATPVRLALAGAAGAGKSTLLACIALRRLDDGAGAARAAVAAHPHELLSGRTSALRHHRVSYDADSAVTLLELPCAGAFARTALFGLCAAAPHAALLCCRAGAAVPPAAAQHLAAALARGLPTVALLTRCDQAHCGDADAAPLRALLAAAAAAAAAAAHALLGAATSHGIDADGAAPLVRDAREATALAAALCARMPRAADAAPPFLPLLFPVIRLSCVAGEGLPALHALLAALAPPDDAHHASTCPASPFVFHVEALLAVAGAGIVAAGVCGGGGCARGARLSLGPLGRRGVFAPVRVASIHASACDVAALRSGQAATLALRECADGEEEDDADADALSSHDDDDAVADADAVAEDAVARAPRAGGLLARALAQRKGLVLLPRAPRPAAVWSFEALLAPLLAHSPGGGALRGALAAGCLPPGACAACMVHCGSVRQAARLLSLSPSQDAAPAAAALRVRAAAAAAVLAGAGAAQPDTCAAAAAEAPPPPALSARLVFAHRPQWLCAGAPLLLADSSAGGALLAAGLVTATHTAAGAP